MKTTLLWKVDFIFTPAVIKPLITTRKPPIIVNMLGISPQSKNPQSATRGSMMYSKATMPLPLPVTAPERTAGLSGGEPPTGTISSLPSTTGVPPTPKKFCTTPKRFANHVRTDEAGPAEYQDLEGTRRGRGILGFPGRLHRAAGCDRGAAQEPGFQ